jgi:cytochrome b561
MTAPALSRPAPLPAASYSLAQILLHWTIAGLVVWQLVFGENLPHASRLLRRGETVDATTAFLADSHIWVGFAILALVTVRLILRLIQGAPPAIETSPLLERAATAAHAAFYFLLFAMPVTGILAYYFRLPTGDIHELGKPAFIVLIAIHAAAALWHQFIRRDGLLYRMIVPSRPAALNNG